MSRLKAVSCGFSLSVCMLFLTCVARAQEKPLPASAAGQLVKFNLIVTDRSNKSVDSILPRDVKVTEDKTEREVVAVEVDQRPVDLGVLIDSSGSFRDLLASCLDAVRLVVVNRAPDDQIYIGAFVSSDNIYTVHPFTNDNNALLESLKAIKIYGGQSAVVDAVYLAVETVAKQNPDSSSRRKALVLITDGEDRNSYYDQERLLKIVHEQGVQIFVLGVTVELDKEAGFIRASPRVKAEKLLKTLAEESGGRVFFPKNRKELAEATVQIIHDLHGQFLVTYQSTNADQKAGYRKFKVEVVSTDGQKRRAISAPGYYFKPTPEKKNDSP